MTNTHPELDPQDFELPKPNIPDFDLLMTDPVAYHMKNHGDDGNWLTRTIDEFIRRIS